MHKLLKRQIRRLLQDDPTRVPAEFLEAIDTAYHQSDLDRQLLERAVSLSSEELLERNDQLQQEANQRSQLAELLRATLESTADGIFAVDSDGRIATYNQRFLELWKMPKSLVDGQLRAKTLEHAASMTVDGEAFLRRVDEIYRDDQGETFDVVELADGRLLERYSRPQQLSGKTAGRVWSFRDVTQRRRLEASLLRSQRLEAIGRLAGGVAHDFNNILTVIRGYCSLAIRADHEGRSAAESLQQIEAAAIQVGELSRQMLALSRQQPLAPEAIDLDSTIAQLERIFPYLLGDRARVRLDLEAAGAKVLADAGSLQQAVFGLLAHVHDALPLGQNLVLRTRHVELHEPARVSAKVRLEPGSYVALEVLGSDSGPASEPSGRETDVDLSAEYEQILRDGGAVTGRAGGTSMRLTLPALELARSLTAAPAAASTGALFTTRLLVVEDDSQVRAVTRQVLAAEGYRVTEAGDAEQALELFHQGRRFDLVISDILMPGLSGYDLAEALDQEYPEVGVLLVSGYSPEEGGRRRRNYEFLQKPYDAGTLLARVESLLAARVPVTPDVAAP